MLSRMGAFFAPVLSPNPHSDSTTIIIIGEFSKASGLGEGARIMARALNKQNLSVHQLDIDPYRFSWKNYYTAFKLLKAYPMATLILHINAPQIPFALLNLPRHLLKNRKIIGYWAWELLVLPREWKAGFQFVHEIWVPSHFVAQAIRPWANQYGKPVYVVPHPLAESFNASMHYLSREALGLPNEPLLVLTSFNLSSSFTRKNPLGAIQAFKKASQSIAQDKICLVLKVLHNKDYTEDFHKIVEAIDGEKNIKLYTHPLNDLENKSLTFHADIILSLHRSEGFGLVPAEAMLQAKPVISTNWSATSEFIDESCGVPIDYSLICVNDPRMVYQIKNAYWAEPNENTAAKAIKTLFYNNNHRIGIGQFARKRIYKYCNSTYLIKQLLKS